MKFLLKILCLLSLLSSFGFSYDEFDVFTDEDIGELKSFNLKTMKKGENSINFIVNDSEKDIVKHCNFQYSGIYFFGNKKFGFYCDEGAQCYYIHGDLKSDYFYYKGNGYNYKVYFLTHDPKDRLYTYSNIIYFSCYNEKVCGLNQNYNTDTGQCVDGCPDGQLWNVNTNSCVVDCSDEDNHKFFTSDYNCIDCSSALTKYDIAKCYCTGLGSSFNRPSFSFSSPSENPNLISTFCDNETEISFKFDKDKMKDKDNNSTNSSDKDKENPKPDKDKDNPNPDKKDNNESSNNSSGEAGNPSNNNSGGFSGNGSSGGGGTGVETKPNPNNGNGKEDGKSDGKEDGKGEEGKGDDNVRPANLDYEGLKASSETFEGQFKTAIDDSFSFVNDVKASLTDTLQKIKDGNLMSLKKGAVPTTCPLSFDVNFIFSNKQITFDLCKVFSSVSSSLYILFYLAFFILFLVVTIKLFILTFMGW